MLNKKLLAAAIAASFTTSAFAAIDLDSSDAAAVKYSSELIANEVAADTVGVFTAVNFGDSTETADGLLDFTTKLGFTVNDGQVRFIRLDLTNGTFTANPTVTLTDLDDTAGTGQEYSTSVSAGGLGATFAIIELTAGGGSTATDIDADQAVVIQGTNYVVSGTDSASIQYRLYETATAASNPDNVTSLALKSAAKNFTNIVDTITGEYATAQNIEAKVAGGFTTIDKDAADAWIGKIDTTAFVDFENDAETPEKDTFDADGDPDSVTEALILATDENYTLTLNGNLGFGTFSLHSGANCSVTAAGVFNSETGVLQTAAETPADVELTGAALAAEDHFVCVTTDEGEAYQKGSYSLTLEGDSGATYEETIGNITFDTTSIEVPYITTFADYNQRIILVNKGNSAASYSMTFTSEGVTDAVPKDAASGSIPAGEMLVLRAADLVTLTGRTRTSAVIEVEGEEENIQAVMQTVNDSDKSTDTVILNANSIRSFVPETETPAT